MTKVHKIVREKDKAIGVRTTKTEFVPCDYVICALDPHFVFNKLIDGKYFGSYFKRRYRDIEKYKSDIIGTLDIMINYFRDIMMDKENADKSMIINADKITFIKNMSRKITYSQVSKIIDIIEETKRKIRSNCNFNISIQVMALNIYEVIK